MFEILLVDEKIFQYSFQDQDNQHVGHSYNIIPHTSTVKPLNLRHTGTMQPLREVVLLPEVDHPLL